MDDTDRVPTGMGKFVWESYVSLQIYVVFEDFNRQIKRNKIWLSFDIIYPENK